ncbi:hypothetical protein [[Mycoplasma] mobile]|uniref:Uncharacterized protein n=1 Tax=Mycoplasma mobile (strain ATCC 43663 / 163K / NCTC 11711) TaxID=267748 RepID=Q6KHM0_MYCM1|nr:hypothetical protein [[Mycoplasma] mobile]AAT27910.1 hypothetical protein MMOB4240 [Mycoplasma mobile 163K]
MQEKTRLEKYLDNKLKNEICSREEERFLIKFNGKLHFKTIINWIALSFWIMNLLVFLFFNFQNRNFLQNSNTLISFISLMSITGITLVFNLWFALFFTNKLLKIKLKIQMTLEKEFNLIEFLNWYFVNDFSFENYSYTNDRNISNLVNNVYFLNKLIRNSYDINLKIQEKGIIFLNNNTNVKTILNSIEANKYLKENFWKKALKNIFYFSTKKTNLKSLKATNFVFTFKSLTELQKESLLNKIKLINTSKEEIIHLENFENFTYVVFVNFSYDFNNFSYQKLDFTKGVESTLKNVLKEMIKILKIFN